MCGIVGYIGRRRALPVLLAGLRRLEYRGYDSAGVAVRWEVGPARAAVATAPVGRVDAEGGGVSVATVSVNAAAAADGATVGAALGSAAPQARAGGRGVSGALFVEKHAGRVAALERALAELPEPEGSIGVGHTRWATHGRPTDVNAHPHTDERERFAVVHNGIIENYRELRAGLALRGHTFRSETDSEIVAHLIEEAYAGDLVQAARAVARQLRGSFALALMAHDEPDRLVGVRHEAPLVVGLGADEGFLASDIAALLPYTRQALVLEDGEIADVRRGTVEISDFDGNPRRRRPLEVVWDADAAERGGFPHFMLKEIHEQPQAVRDTLRGRLDGERLALPELDRVAERLACAGRIWLVACGTAYHACLVGRRLIEAWARCPAEADLASEFRYRQPLVAVGDGVVAVSQSGETADTLAALREGCKRGGVGIAVANVVGSSIPREAEAALYTWAGPEIAVASTKAYVTQLVALTLLALRLGEMRGTLAEAERRQLTRELDLLPGLVTETLAEVEAPVQAVAAELARHDQAFFVGRGLDWAVAMEGQLKLKEISYLHAEAYAAGELKHGALALVAEGSPLVALFTQPDLVEKTASNVAEVRARGGWVISVATASLAPLVAELADRLIVVPDVSPWLAPAVAAVPLQLLAYYAALARGTDVDKPRNLAKSVTVE